jgi:hypothetical protein
LIHETFHVYQRRAHPKWASLTEPVGAHPLFEGVRRLIVTGLAEPRVSEADGKVTIEAAGVTASFGGAVERAANSLVLHVK